MSSVTIPSETTFDALMRRIVADVRIPHQHKEDRNKSIFSGFHGLSGGAGTTLEEQGRAHGDLTKECVRQVIANIQAQLYLDDEGNRFVRQMVAEITAELPCSLEVLTKTLTDRGYLTPGIESPKGLVDLAFKMARSKERPRFQNINGHWFVSIRSKADQVSKVRSETQKTVGKYGICSISGIIARMGLKNTDTSRKFVVDTLSATHEITYLSDDREWITCDPGYSDRLTKRILSVFSVYRKVEVSVLYRVMARSLRQIKEPCQKSPEYRAFGFGSLKAINEEREKKGLPLLNRKPFLGESDMKMAFGIDVFVEFLKLIPGLRVENQSQKQFVIADAPIEGDDSPSRTILSVIELLDRQPGKTMRETDIKHQARLDQNGWYRFITASNFSPLISRVKRGTYRTLGEVFK